MRMRASGASPPRGWAGALSLFLTGGIALGFSTARAEFPAARRIPNANAITVLLKAMVISRVVQLIGRRSGFIFNEMEE